MTIQETHWSVGDMAIWGGLFAGAEVVATEARPGPNWGGPQGGVAIVIPVRYEVLRRRTVIPGLCAEATIRRRVDLARTTWAVQSLHLPPDERRNATAACVDNIGRGEEALYVGCDLNMQVQSPGTTRSKMMRRG